MADMTNLPAFKAAILNEHPDATFSSSHNGVHSVSLPYDASQEDRDALALLVQSELSNHGLPWVPVQLSQAEKDELAAARAADVADAEARAKREAEAEAIRQKRLWEES